MKFLTIIASVVAALGFAACGGSTTTFPDKHSPTTATDATATGQSTAQQVAAWWSTHSESFSTIVADMTQVGTDASSGDVAMTESDCITWQRDLDKFETDAPDEELARHLDVAISSFKTAAADCAAGLFSDATSEITTGHAAVDRATARVKELTP